MKDFVCARVDVAGSGDSDGLLDDEYVQRELNDGVEAINWLAQQPFSNGSVGMIGISWGGFNSLQIAAMNASVALKAIISICAGVDRYHGDCHYTGGCMNEENVEWGTYLFMMQGLPPDPAVVGPERWREMWKKRIDGAKMPIIEWLRHQSRDEFWKHGSACENFDSIRIPVLAVSGWNDGYCQAPFELVQNIKNACVKGIIGPWGHKVCSISLSHLFRLKPSFAVIIVSTRRRSRTCDRLP
jgi:putative CocE/NonD family hydrolase